MAEELKSKLDAYILENPEWYENLVLGCIIKDRKFYLKVREVLNVEFDKKTLCNDFSDIYKNIVYRIVSRYNGNQENLLAKYPENKFISIAESTLNTLLHNQAVAGDSVLEEEIPTALATFKKANEVDVAQWISYVDANFVEWIGRVKTLKVIKSPYAFGAWTYNEIYRRLGEIEKQVSPVNYGTTISRGLLGKFLDNPIVVEQHNVLPSNIPGLNDALAGGFGRKETIMLISPPSGGKTIFACQLAGHWASIGYGGIFVTTEQTQDELEIRMVSNFAGIPFKNIVRKWDPTALSEKHAHNYMTWRKSIKAPVMFVDWTIPGSKNVVTDLENEITHYKEEFGKNPDFLIFDWIGGALQQMAKGDPSAVRWLYKEAVDSICGIARKYDIAGVVLAQATPGNSINKYPLDHRDLAEAKNMTERITALIGLTALMSRDMDRETDHAQIVYAEKQFLCVPKTRKGPGANVPVKRDYGYQRIGVL
jgi:hypothetical protein